jgi:hypothetical protein
LDPDGDQSLAETIGADVLAWALARKLPGRLAGVSDHCVGAACCDQVEDECGERFGQDGRGGPNRTETRPFASLTCTF